MRQLYCTPINILAIEGNPPYKTKVLKYKTMNFKLESTDQLTSVGLTQAVLTVLGKIYKAAKDIW